MLAELVVLGKADALAVEVPIAPRFVPSEGADSSELHPKLRAAIAAAVHPRVRRAIVGWLLFLVFLPWEACQATRAPMPQVFSCHVNLFSSAPLG
jgi:hypothetical protein